MATVVSPEQRDTCPTCLQTFASPRAYKVHLNYHIRREEADKEELSCFQRKVRKPKSEYVKSSVVQRKGTPQRQLKVLNQAAGHMSSSSDPKNTIQKSRQNPLEDRHGKAASATTPKIRCSGKNADGYETCSADNNNLLTFSIQIPAEPVIRSSYVKLDRIKIPQKVEAASVQKSKSVPHNNRDKKKSKKLGDQETKDNRQANKRTRKARDCEIVDPSDGESTSDGYKFTCSVCSLEFLNLRLLKSHESLHQDSNNSTFDISHRASSTPQDSKGGIPIEEKRLDADVKIEIAIDVKQEQAGKTVREIPVQTTENEIPVQTTGNEIPVQTTEIAEDSVSKDIDEANIAMVPHVPMDATIIRVCENPSETVSTSQDRNSECEPHEDSGESLTLAPMQALLQDASAKRKKFAHMLDSAAAQQEKPFTCELCSKAYKSYTFYERHMRYHESTESKFRKNPLQCPACQLPCIDDTALRKHVEVHMGNTPQPSAKESNEAPSDIPNASSAGTESLCKPVDMKCVQCNIQFSSKPGFKSHMRSHSGSKKLYKCEVCGAVFNQNGSLLVHMRRHTGEKPFQCEVCGKKFVTKTSCNTHIRTHTNERPYSCEVCGDRFKQIGHLSHHMRRHNDGTSRTNCPTCKKTFVCASVLKTHMLIHSDSRPHVCNICGKGFRQKGHLKEHGQTHLQPEDRVSFHQCPTCDKYFTTSSSLKTHMLVHSGEKPHQCEICGRHFRQLGHLKDHKDTHKRTRPDLPPLVKKRNLVAEKSVKMKKTENVKTGIQCPNCPHISSDVMTFKAHIAKHSKVNFYSMCHICDKVFPTQSDLSDHLTTHGVLCLPHCSICQRTFCTEEIMMQHGLSAHVTERDPTYYQCQLCNRQFVGVAELRTHITESHHVGDVDRVIQDSARAVSVDTYGNPCSMLECNLCELLFAQTDNAGEHFLIHAVKKQISNAFKCDPCQEILLTDGAVKKHRLEVHSGLTFKCPLCSIEFMTMALLGSHVSQSHGMELVKEAESDMAGSAENESGSVATEHAYPDIHRLEVTPLCTPDNYYPKKAGSVAPSVAPFLMTTDLMVAVAATVPGYSDHSQDPAQPTVEFMGTVPDARHVSQSQPPCDDQRSCDSPDSNVLSAQRWANAGPAGPTLARHWPNDGSTVLLSGSQPACDDQRPCNDQRPCEDLVDLQAPVHPAVVLTQGNAEVESVPSVLVEAGSTAPYQQEQYVHEDPSAAHSNSSEEAPTQEADGTRSLRSSPSHGTNEAITSLSTTKVAQCGTSLSATTVAQCGTSLSATTVAQCKLDEASSCHDNPALPTEYLVVTLDEDCDQDIESSIVIEEEAQHNLNQNSDVTTVYLVDSVEGKGSTLEL